MDISRRELLTGVATGTAAGGAALLVGSQSAEASVTMGKLQIPNASFEDDDGEIYAPWVSVAGDWEFTVNESPTEWRVYLLVGDGNNSWSALDMVSGTPSTKSATGAYSILGDITASSAWSSNDFSAPGPGESKIVTVPVQVYFIVLGDTGTLAEAAATKNVDIEITHTGAGASVGGDGTIEPQYDESDPSPTPPG